MELWNVNDKEKTPVMIILRNEKCLSIIINKQNLEEIGQFKFLQSIIMNDDRCKN